ncbi:saccharopine dehydrogenase family protein [Brucellaceae bacterium C25G]
MQISQYHDTWSDKKADTKRLNIIVVGGYGHVGRQIAFRLISDERFNVRIAGRDTLKASIQAEKLKCEATFIDITRSQTWDRALNGIDVVIVCIDQTETHFVEHVLKSGRHYLDITADNAFFQKVEGLAPVARRFGSVALLSIGLAPGLTNLLVREAVNNMDYVSDVRIGILLGLGDTHGPAAIDWTLRNFTFSPIENIRFGHNNKSFPAILFDFADQHVLRRTLNIMNIRTFMTFDSPFISRILFRLLPFIAKRPFLRRLVRNSMSLLRIGSDQAALSVQAEGSLNGKKQLQGFLLEGKKEGAITALVAAETIKLLAEMPIKSDVWHIDQVFSINQYAHQLAAEGITLTMSNNTDRSN